MKRVARGDRHRHGAWLGRGAWLAVWLSTGLSCGASGDPAAGAAGAGPDVSGAAGDGSARGGSGAGAAGGGGPDGSGGTHTSESGGAGAGAPASGGQPSDGSTRSRLERYHQAAIEPSLSFELDVVAGLEPYPSSLEYLAPFVGRVLDKPAGVSFETDEVLEPFGADHAWTFSALDAYARAHARDDGDGSVSIHVLLLDGRYDGGDATGSVLGLAWGQRYIALFQQTIRSGCSGGLLGGLSAEACAVAERNVWAHEIGHVVGLVDNGLTQQTPHRDAEHGRHDVSDGCLMYWAYERPEIFDTLLLRLNAGQSADLDFCENCWADLNAARP